jgi:hypothetical protein
MNLKKLYRILMADGRIKYFTSEDDYMSAYKDRDVMMFDWVSPGWFADRGMPHKAGYIIYYGDKVVRKT